MNNVERIVSHGTDFKTPIEIALGVDDNGMTTAKKLYAFLELEPKNYSRWCRTNIVENEFAEENIDYWAFVMNEEWGGQATKDYKLTSHFAKKLSVKGSGTRAEEAREYFTRVEERAKQFTIDRTKLSPQMQMFYAIADGQARMELEQKRQAEKIEKLETNQKAITETFISTADEQSFQVWANKCLSRIAESPKYDKGRGRTYNYASARAESYDRLKKKWNCNLDDRVARARGRAIERKPDITKKDLNAINKLTVIAGDKSLRPVYETVIKEMMIAYCVQVV